MTSDHATDPTVLAQRLRQAIAALEACASLSDGAASTLAAGCLEALRGDLANPPDPGSAGWVALDYTNHRGQRDDRLVLPTGRLLRGPSAWHPRSPWLVEAYDRDKAALRTFDPADVHAWSSASQPPPGA